MRIVKTLQGDDWLKHPAHPAAIPLPIGMWVFSLVMDGIAQTVKNNSIQKAADYAVTGGLIGAALSAITGISEYQRIPKTDAAKPIALLHGTLNATATAAYIINRSIRSSRQRNGKPVGILPKLISLAGVGTITYTGWLGGDLAYNYGVGVGVSKERILEKPLRREQEIKPTTAGTTEVRTAQTE